MNNRIHQSIRLGAICAAATLVSVHPPAFAQAHGHDHADSPNQQANWGTDESSMLTNYVQLTFPQEYVKAGESYFSPDGKWIIFQAVPVPPEGESPDAHYSMYVGKLSFDRSGRITGLQRTMRISEPGSANTCGFFHPTEQGHVIFGSTITPPASDAKGGYQRGESRYSWQFPDEMEILTRFIPAVYYTDNPKLTTEIEFTKEQLRARPLFERNGYDAECAYSPDGRWIVHASVDPETGDADLFVFDIETNRRTAIVEAEGYDGGPFFSPDGRRICYRSDRQGNDLLQIFVADLAFDEDGQITGIQREHQLTNNEHVNWGPFWHPSGEYLVYATSEVGHHNYEVFAIEAPPQADAPVGSLAKRRITHAPGFDGLPVFSRDGALMMWTSQRGEKLPHEERPSSQVWVATVIDIVPGR